jgi:hypothetical protein
MPYHVLVPGEDIIADGTLMSGLWHERVLDRARRRLHRGSYSSRTIMDMF